MSTRITKFYFKCMKILSAIILTLFVSATLTAQSFEGEITYQNDDKSKIPNLADQQLASMIGQQFDYYIKGNKYKTISNGSFLQWQIYNPAGTTRCTIKCPTAIRLSALTPV